MNDLVEKDQLVADLIYLRKGRGLSTGSLATRTEVIHYLGGPTEELCVIRLRLIAAVDLLEDELNREALRAAYGLLPATEGFSTTAERRRAYGRVVGRKADTLADREMAAIEELSLALMSSPYRTLQSLRPDTLFQLRQLYRYGQEALMHLEAFDVMAMIVSTLRQADAGPIYRMALGNISNESHFTDLALWSFAQCHSAFVRVISDPVGARFLRDGLPSIWWAQRLDRPMSGHSTRAYEEFDQALTEAENADEFGQRLRRSPGTMRMETEWRQLLSAEDLRDDPEGEYGGDREDLRVRLVALCQFLARMFPEDTRPAEETKAYYGVTVHDCLVLVGEYATARSIPDDQGRVEQAIRLALAFPPKRHIFGYKEDYVL